MDWERSSHRHRWLSSRRPITRLTLIDKATHDGWTEGEHKPTGELKEAASQPLEAFQMAAVDCSRRSDNGEHN